jgi:hypothetical protein
VTFPLLAHVRALPPEYQGSKGQNGLRATRGQRPPPLPRGRGAMPSRQARALTLTYAETAVRDHDDVGPSSVERVAGRLRFVGAPGFIGRRIRHDDDDERLSAAGDQHVAFTPYSAGRCEGTREPRSAIAVSEGTWGSVPNRRSRLTVLKLASVQLGFRRGPELGTPSCDDLGRAERSAGHAWICGDRARHRPDDVARAEDGPTTNGEAAPRTRGGSNLAWFGQAP